MGKRKCLSTFFSTEFRTDRRVNGGSNKEPLTRRGDEAFGDLNSVIVGEIEENDDKVRSVYGGSVEQAACRNLARSCAPKPGRVPKPDRRSHAKVRPGRVRRSLAGCRVPKTGRPPVTARRGPVRRGPARAGGGRETGKTDSTTGEITCACRRMTDRARRFANFWKQIDKKRQSPIRLRGISSANQEKRQSSTRRSVFSGVFRARGVTTTLLRKPNGRARHFTNFRKIEENDKVRSVYGGSVGETRISV